ncbi:MAG: Holliday junction branch migration DNA helicase RuvB [Chloroflexi bacterium]|nr:Holliday junction branch migration DNA helicase RuvB [Chloroflexota bacterium]
MRSIPLYSPQRERALVDRIVTASTQPDDAAVEASLRPRRLDEFIGQTKIKENLGIFIDAAMARSEPLDHVLLYGPPGLGKTTLANIIAAEMRVNIRTTSGPAVEHPGELAAILTRLGLSDVLFIDEIHRLRRIVEEALYPAMEDFVWDIIVGKGPGAQSLRLNLQQFTVIGATTRMALLTSPLRDRFGAIYRLDFYDEAELTEIIRRSARILSVHVDEDSSHEIARRARGTPRVANRLLKRVRDYAQVRADGRITRSVAMEALARLDVDELGLDEVDRKMLLTIIDKFGGGPVGIETIAAAMSEEADTIMDVFEPFLIQLGFLARRPRGRVATPGAYAHLGRTPPTRLTPSEEPQQRLL